MNHRAGTYRRAAICTVVCQVARVDTIILKQAKEAAYRVNYRAHKATDTADLHQSITCADQAYATNDVAPKSETAACRTATRTTAAADRRAASTATAARRTLRRTR